jgi:hypothetical protein
MQWKNLAERTVYENKWLTVNLADVELPNGKHLDHFLIRQRPVALCAAVNEQNEVLLLWRHRFITDTWGWERVRSTNGVSGRSVSSSQRPAIGH